MTAELTPEMERTLLTKHATTMADNLIAFAHDNTIDLRGLMESHYKWFDWLRDAFKDDGEVRDAVFWNLSHFYAAHFADMNDEPEAYLIRRLQVAHHAIKIIGQKIYPLDIIRWEPISPMLEAVTFDPDLMYFERSWPVIQDYNGELLAVYYVAWIERTGSDDRWQSVLSVLSIDNLTEYDWLQRANECGRPNQHYDMDEMLYDFIYEGQGTYLWKSQHYSKRSDAIAATREQAEWIAGRFETVMDVLEPFAGKPGIQNLRVVGYEETWVELKELRDRFGGDSKAINRHSIRIYQYGPKRYMLDRTLDTLPPNYTLYWQDTTHRFLTPIIEVDGQISWGDGLSWAKAEARARQAVHDRVWRKQ